MSRRMIRNQSVRALARPGLHAKCNEKIATLFHWNDMEDQKMGRLQKQVDSLTSELVQLWGYNPDEQEMDVVSECLRHKLRKFVRNAHTCCKRSCCTHKDINDGKSKKEEMLGEE